MYGGDSGSAEQGEKVQDDAYNFNIVQSHFSKSEFIEFIKKKLKNLIGYLEANGKGDRVGTFQAGVKE